MVSIFSLVFLWILFDYLSIENFVEPTHTQATPQNGLMESIKAEAENLRIEPIDAKLDPVWKAIPGYNGREVDIESTYRIAKKLNGNADNIPFIYKEITPRVKLNDIGAHPIYKGNPNKKMASIMINVAWGNDYIPPILKTLEAENVQATFFLDGSWLRKNADLAIQIVKGGHEIANHGYSHKNMSSLSKQNIIQEITKTEALISQHLDLQSKLFAPPSGDYNQQTVDIAHDLKMKTILWTIDTVDWKDPSPDWITARIKANIEPGSLILMHPKPSSTSALTDMIQIIRDKGLVLGTVSELISAKRIPEVETNINFW